VIFFANFYSIRHAIKCSAADSFDQLMSAFAAGQAWHLLSQISLDTDLFLCRFGCFGVLLSEIGFHFDGICFSSVLLDGPMGLDIQM
jgi:hypothetical protein